MKKLTLAVLLTSACSAGSGTTGDSPKTSAQPLAAFSCPIGYVRKGNRCIHVNPTPVPPAPAPAAGRRPSAPTPSTPTPSTPTPSAPI
jgi:hypothetical protein